MAPLIEPDFDRYALALIHEERIVFSSVKAGIEPLADCIAECGGRYRHCILHDRVFGLAAARLIVPTDLIGTLVTRAVSQPAKTYLESKGIEVRAEAVVEAILTRDRSRVCPGEVIALETDDPELFARRMKEMMSR